MKKTRILIADDHDVVRSGLRMLLRTAPEFSITGEAADGEEAVHLVEKQKPDIVFMDISMPKLDGIEATKIIKQQFPETHVIILTVHEDEEYAFHVLRAGASGYLLKNASRKEIFEAVRSAMAGRRFFSPGISKIIVDGFMKRENEGIPHGAPEEKKEPAAGQQLTKREMEVLQYIAEGYTNRQIAETLFLSFRTVNTHRANLMQKLNIHDTAGLVRHAINLGIVKSGS
ncbi:MAG TPA: response regulator transcription factor [Bacteroidota bacterium]|nr:response regulator transcription factor [Bacteroidota bacterium]